MDAGSWAGSFEPSFAFASVGAGRCGETLERDVHIHRACDLPYASAAR